MLVRKSRPPGFEDARLTSDHVYNRASVHACVNGWSGNRYKGFATFEEAKFYLEAAGHTTFHFDQGPGDGPKPRSSLEAYYSVARGRQTGIQQTYG